MRNVLMVAYLFPPAGGIGAAGSQRVLKFAKYLPNYCWRPVILTVREGYYEPYLSLDQTLLEKVPAGTKIVRTAVIRWFTKLLELQKSVKTHLLHSYTETANHVSLNPIADRSRESRWPQRLKDAITDLFEIPDEEMGWLLPSAFSGLRTVRRESIDAIYSTGRPWTAHLVGLVLRQLTHRPLVVDFRDPWMTNPFRAHYSTLKNKLESILERRVIETADVVIANTVELREEFLQRFPQQPHSKFITLLNGFDPDDYPFEEKSGSNSVNSCFTVTHTGFLYGKRDPKPFFEAVKFLLDKELIDRRKLKIVLVGSIELPYDLTEYLFATNLRDLVVLREHVPYRQSLQFLQEADVLLLLQPGTTTQIPSKLFEYIGMRKPIMAISPRHGATCQLIASEGLGVVADPENVEEIGHVLLRLYQAWKSGSLMSMVNGATHLKFDVKNITGCLAETLSCIVSS